MLYPLLAFLWSGWQQRSREILGSLNAPAKKQYLSIFQKSNKKNSIFDVGRPGRGRVRKILQRRIRSAEILRSARAVFHRRGGRDFLLADPLRAFILAKADVTAPPFGTVAAALAGGYTFVCWDLFARMQQKTLSRAAIPRATLRLAVAVPIGVVFAILSKENPQLLAFAIGVFPIQGISDLLQRLIKKFFPAQEKTAAARDQVFALSGIDTMIAERIDDADITTITQLAWADPVQLTMRTNLQFAFVLDIISQALAWVYLEGKLESLGPVGLRGAAEIGTALKDIGEIPPDQEHVEGHPDYVVMDRHETTLAADGVREADVHVEVTPPLPPRRHQSRTRSAETANAAITQAAKIAEVERPALLYALIQIGEDPTARFLDVSWSSLTEGR